MGIKYTMPLEKALFKIDEAVQNKITFITPHGTYHLEQIKDMQDLLAIVEDGRRYRALKAKIMNESIDELLVKS